MANLTTKVIVLKVRVWEQLSTQHFTLLSLCHPHLCPNTLRLI